MRCFWICVIVLCGWSGSAIGHVRSESVSHWTYDHGVLDGVITVPSREVTRLMLPGENYSSLTQILTAHLATTITAAMDGRPCVAVRAPSAMSAEPGYLRIRLNMQCEAGRVLAIRIGAFFMVAPSHHHFIYIQTSGGATRDAILGLSSTLVEVDTNASHDAPNFLQFVLMGIEHIWTGTDHLAFLLALLIIPRSTRQVLLTITGFTVGHSLTLSLAVIGVVQANRGAVEALIGLTIALAAALNLIRGAREGRIGALVAALIIGSVLLVPSATRPDMPPLLVGAIALVTASAIWLGSIQPPSFGDRSRFVMAAGFGLVHGLGFASALQDLHLPTTSLVETLFGFNVGVELGQLMAILFAYAAARAIVRIWPRFRANTPAATMVSAALLALGIAWFLTRAGIGTEG